MFVLIAATLLIGLSTPEESVFSSLSLGSLSLGNGITGAAIGLQDPIIEEPIEQSLDQSEEEPESFPLESK